MSTEALVAGAGRRDEMKLTGKIMARYQHFHN